MISQCITTTRFSVAINRELGGYFRGTKGLRQGDPLSPYLFVLSMEVLAKLLNVKFKSGLIGYHPVPSSPQVTHLSFADDIMVFFDAQKSSLIHISDTLDQFSSWSGLVMNISKAELFVAGLSLAETTDLVNLGFSLGSLPVRYLGLPRMHRKLCICDYRPLIDQLKSRFSSWTSRALSFAGRKQLLSSVIYGKANFWFSTFLLPKGCIKAIESLCARFVWNRNVTTRAVAKVSWSSVCLPKQEGGLGLRDLTIWNTSLCLNLIWLLHTENESLWAMWTKTNRIGDKNFLSIDESKQTSWIWKSILKLRPIAENFLKCEVGNGDKASFWFYDWSPMGRLFKLFGHSGPRQLGVPINALVSSCCSSTGWNLRHARSPLAEQVHIMLCSISLPSSSSVPDKFLWQVGDITLQSYSASLTWEELRHHGQRQSWTCIVWFKGHIPSHAFMMWIAYLDCLPTRMRLASWGLQIDKSCCICNHYEESRDHLFLRCSFSEQLWKLLMRRMGYRPFLFHTWTAMHSWLETADSTCPYTLRLLVVQATIYKIWAERNRRLHCSVSSTPQNLLRDIDRLVRNVILARKKHKKFHTLMQCWLKFA